jgi:hypothetical protein
MPWGELVKLPRGEQVEIDDRKVREYLLSHTHPVGRFKARFFAAIGFDETTVAAFVAELRRIAEVGEIDGTEDIEFGRKYTVPGELRGPAGVAQVVTVWIQERGRQDVRLVTVRPR